VQQVGPLKLEEPLTFDDNTNGPRLSFICTEPSLNVCTSWVNDHKIIDI